jgi:hypothetical protein
LTRSSRYEPTEACFTSCEPLHPGARDVRRDLVASVELPEPDVIAGFLQLRNDQPAAPIDRQDLIGCAM